MIVNRLNNTVINDISSMFLAGVCTVGALSGYTEYLSLASASHLLVHLPNLKLGKLELSESCIQSIYTKSEDFCSSTLNAAMI